MSAPLDDTWQTADAIRTQLARLDADPSHADKKKATILAIVGARLEFRSEESVWDDPRVCNRATYHSRWKKQPLFADVLKQVTQAAKAHRDSRAARSLAQAGERLALAANPAVGRLVQLLTSDDEGIILRAAVAILDRAGLETAQKATAATAGDLEEWRRQADERRRQVEETIEEFDTDDADEGAADEDTDPEE